EYPETPWSVGRMRKVADVRRGRPELEEPGIAEAERLAGANIFARGGGATAQRAEAIRGAGGISPDLIQQQKAQLQAFGSQWAAGLVDWKKINKWSKDRGWSSILDLDPLSRLNTRIEPGTQVIAEDTFKRIEKSKGKEAADRFREKFEATPGNRYIDK